MKKAFTLIELLVVIAIIAILAAILFPVFAQAKLAAKKTQSISNQKQTGLGIILYTGDYDDLYPRQDGCTLNDSLNPAFNNVPSGTNPAPYCNGAGVGGRGHYAFRDNHYSWHKWIVPYTKNVQLFIDPVQTPDAKSWNVTGELEGGYLLNIAITGSLNTWNYPIPYTNTAAIRNSWIGGSTTAVPSPAEAMLIMSGPYNAVVPVYSSLTSNRAIATSFPLAIREHWTGYFYKAGGTGYCNTSTVIDPAIVPFGNQIPMSFTDGHTKTMAVGQFLANTPLAAEFGATTTGCFGYPGPNGAVVSGINAPTNWSPTTTKPWPMWGLQ